MERSKITVRLRIPGRGIEEDVEFPVLLTANQLIQAVNGAYDLGIHTGDMETCYLKTENPIALLKGNQTMKEAGLYDGSLITITM